MSFSTFGWRDSLCRAIAKPERRREKDRERPFAGQAVSVNPGELVSVCAGRD